MMGKKKMMGEESHETQNEKQKWAETERDQKRDRKREADGLRAREGDYELCVWLLEADGSLSDSDLTALPQAACSPHWAPT